MLHRVQDQVISITNRQGKLLRIVRERYLRTDITCQIAGCKLYVDTVVNYLELFEEQNVTGIVFAQTVLEAIENEMRLANRKNLCHRIRRFTNNDTRISMIFSNENYQATAYCPKSSQSAIIRRDYAIAKLAAWLTSHIASASIQCSVIFISDKPDVVQFAQGLSVKALTMKEYATTFLDQSGYVLYETLMQVAEEKKSQNHRSQSILGAALKLRNPYDEYVEWPTEEELEAGVKAGYWYRGALHVNASYNREATVKLQHPMDGAYAMVVVGENFRNRAMNGDRVVVEPVPNEEVVTRYRSYSHHPGPFARVVGVESTRKRTFVCTLQIDETTEHQNPNSIDLRSLDSTRTSGAKNVVESSEQSQQQQQQQLRHHHQGSNPWMFAVPWDDRIPKIRIRSRHREDLVNMRIVVRVDDWPIDSRYPQGHYVKSLGPIDEHETEMQVLLHEADVSTTAFSKSVLDELPPHSPPDSPWRANMYDPRFGPRRDLTDWRIYSIDPPGCQDIDDALSYRELENGNIQIGVHIADVTAFVLDGSYLDAEARQRSTSVYLTDRRIDMLPTLLSERLCSLRYGEPRYAVSVIWEMDVTGKVLHTWFGRTMIKTAYEMCYSDAQDILDGKPSARAQFSDYDLLFKELSGLRSIFRILSAQRHAKGALELESTEVRFVLDETKMPKQVATKEHLEVHDLVAEFMIFANCAVAEFLASKLPESALLRRHPLPNSSKFRDVLELAQSRGCHIDFSSNRALSQSLHRAATETGDSMFMYMLRSLTTLAMSEAEYFSSGTCSPDLYYHYGLAAEYYTHFTSPIRRYADILVHRQLLAILDQEHRIKEAIQKGQYDPNHYSEERSYMESHRKQQITSTNRAESPDLSIYAPSNLEVESIAEHLNYKNRQAKAVQRHSKDLYQTLYFAHRENQDVFDVGVVVGIKQNSLMIFFPKYGYHGRLRLSEIAAQTITSQKLDSSIAAALIPPPSDELSALKISEPHDQRRKGEESSPPHQDEENEMPSPIFQVAEDGTQLQIVIGTDKHFIKLFDQLKLQIGVVKNRYHSSTIRLKSISWSTQGSAATPSNTFSTNAATNAKNNNANTIMNNSATDSNSSATRVSPTTMISEVTKAEALAKIKMADEKMNFVPKELQSMAKSKTNRLYRWCQFDPSSFPFLTRLDVCRALASYVLSRRALLVSSSRNDAKKALTGTNQHTKNGTPATTTTNATPSTTTKTTSSITTTTPTNSSATTSSSSIGRARKLRQPIHLAPPKAHLSGRRVFKEREYRAGLAEAEEYDETDENSPDSDLIIGASFGPSKAFGSTNAVAAIAQASRAAEAVLRAEREFRVAQAQVSKSKYATRHY